MPSEFTPEEIAAAMQVLQGMKTIGQKHDLSPAAGVAPYMHGSGGLFSTPGVDPRVFSAMQLPMMGLLDVLPVMPAGSSLSPDTRSEYGGADVPFYDLVTGVTAGNLDSFANQPDEPCDDPPEPGLLKACTLTAPYGRFYGKVRAVDLQRVARVTNRGESTDLTMMNQIPIGGFVTPTPAGAGMPGNFVNELNARLFEAAVSWKRMIAPLVYSGNPTANKAGGGAKQFVGLDLLINTGNKVDAITANVCTALNSEIYNFGYNLLNGSGNDIVTYLDSLFHQLEWNAIQQGLDPVEFVIVMRPEAFDEIAKVWPIRYYVEALEAMGQYTNGRVSLDARETTEMRDDMRNNLFLPVRGKRRRVVLDNTIVEDNVTTTGNLLAGQYASDIYVVPLTVLGGIPVTYIEPFNYDAGNISAVKNFLGLDNSIAFRTSDGGKFLWWSHRTNTCLDYRWLTEFRVIMRTPQLAGRIENVAYQPLRHTRDWQTNSAYFVNGGRTNGGPISRYYTEYSTTTPVNIG